MLKASPGPSVTSCYLEAYYNFRQTDNVLEVNWFPALSGTIQEEYRESLTGTLENGHITLDGQRELIQFAGSGPGSPRPTSTPETLTYNLNFDETTQQLVGTRNGVPIRLVYQEDEKGGPYLGPSGECNPPP